MRRGLPLRREDFVEFLGSIGEGTRLTESESESLDRSLERSRLL
jgi:hypothetical protein